MCCDMVVVVLCVSVACVCGGWFRSDRVPFVVVWCIGVGLCLWLVLWCDVMFGVVLLCNVVLCVV